MDVREQEIIYACQQGDSARFGELYDLYLRRIYTFIYYRTHRRETSEDLTSETFFKALRNIRQCNPERPFAGWLYRIARNTVIDHYRRTRPTLSIEDAWDIAEDSDLENQIAAKADYALIRKMLQKLSPDQRDVVLLRVWEDLPYKEIARIMEKTEDNCRVLFSRAIHNLRTAPLLLLIAINILVSS